MLPTIAREDDEVVMVDQRKLPAREVYVRCRTAAEVARAIKTMVIRGAPAIGVAAAMGIALGMRKSKATGTQKLAAEFYKMCELMAGTRPTAVNLFWAIDRMKRSLGSGVQAGQSVDELKARLEAEAIAIHDEDLASCQEMGRVGAEVVPDGARILTHCNAGALATADHQTAGGRFTRAGGPGKNNHAFFKAHQLVDFINRFVGITKRVHVAFKRAQKTHYMMFLIKQNQLKKYLLF
jgi:methylthioribose-1-phosphate isomerase